MGVLGGLLDFASHAVQPALQVATARAQGQLASRQQQMQQMLQQIVLQRQAREDAIKQALAQSTIGKNTAQVDALKNKRTIVRGPGGQLVDATDPTHIVPIGPAPVVKPTAQGHVVDPVTGEVKFFDPTKPPGDLHVHPRPQPPASNVYLTGTDPTTGQPAIFAGTSKGQPKLTNMDVGKPTASGGGSQSLSPEDRQRMINQARLDNQVMKDFEAKVLAGKESVGVTSGVLGSLSAGDPRGVMGGILTAVGNASTGKVNPDYQKYLTAQRSFGRVMGNLQSKRYSDNQAEIERSISGLGASDLNPTIQYKQQLRDAAVADVGTHGAPPPQHTGHPSGHGAAKVPTYEEWRKMKGLP